MKTKKEKKPDYESAIDRLRELADYQRQSSRQLRMDGHWNEARNFATAAMCLEYASDKLAIEG